MQQPKQAKINYPYKSESAASLGNSQTTLWLGGLETWEDENYLYLIFQQILPAYCVVTNITIVRDAVTEASLGYGFVDFGTHQAAETALQICRKAVRPGHSRPFRISWAASNTFSHKRAASTMLAPAAPMPPSYPIVPAAVAPPAAPAVPAPDENLTLYVTPLEKHITKFTLAEEIKKFGYTSIISIKIAHNVNGISRGFGFVRFGNRDECKDALEKLKTLRFGENQQPLHVTLARCNSYDPEYTVSNEALFGNNSQNSRRHNNNNANPAKRQKRLPYPSAPPHTGPPSMVDRSGVQSGQMIMPKMHPSASYTHLNMSGSIGMPASGSTPQYVMPPMMGIPAPLPATSPYTMTSLQQSTYQPQASSSLPSVMTMPNMMQPGVDSLALNPNMGMNSNMGPVSAPPGLMPSPAMMAPMPSSGAMNMSAPPAPSPANLPPHPPSSASSTASLSSNSVYATLPSLGDLNYYQMSSSTSPTMSAIPGSMANMPVGGYTPNSTSMQSAALQNSITSAGNINKNLYTTNMRPVLNMPQTVHNKTNTTSSPFISAAPVTISTRNKNESCENNITTSLTAATISSPPNLTSKNLLVQNNNSTSYAVGMSCRVTPPSTSEINAYSGA